MKGIEPDCDFKVGTKSGAPTTIVDHWLACILSLLLLLSTMRLRHGSLDWHSSDHAMGKEGSGDHSLTTLMANLPSELLPAFVVSNASSHFSNGYLGGQRGPAA